MVAFPLVLPMGWVNSPPYFSAVTETAADLMNDAFKRSEEYPPHRLEDQALQVEADNDLGSRNPTHSLTEPTIHPPRLRQRLKYVDIYVDDFIALLQGNAEQQRQAMQLLLHILDKIFREGNPLDQYRQEPASVKKLRKGDAKWAT